MLQTKITEMMADANKFGWALGAFNVPSFDSMRAVMQASKDTSTPVIVQVSSRIVSFYGAFVLKSWFDTIQNYLKCNCFLHLDHCQDETIINECIASKWDMIMFDGSSFDIKKNINFTKKYVKLAHDNNVAVEGELGIVGGEEDGVTENINYAKLEDIEIFCLLTDLDCIAIGFGNVHGNYQNKKKLRWDIFEGAYERSNLPLVLHGGTGLTFNEFKKAISAKAAKINISTSLKENYFKTILGSNFKNEIVKNPHLFHEKVFQNVYESALFHVSIFKRKESNIL